MKDNLYEQLFQKFPKDIEPELLGHNERADFSVQAQAQETILHNFGDGSVTNDGKNSFAGLIQGTDGNFYGTTYYGGSAGDGAVFKMTPGGTVAILHNFGDGSVTHDGLNPHTNLIQGSDGNFYGITTNGGSASEGIVFKITSTGTYTILHSFGDGSVTNDGNYPNGGLIQASDGNFYGVTAGGGSTNKGTVFMITPTGTVTIFHSFGTVTNDGYVPAAGLIQASDGNFYGTTFEGGPAGYGNVFKITPGGTVTNLHSFQDGSVTNDGEGPQSSLIQGSDGNLYGTTPYGGSASFGTAFKITLSGTVSILYSFLDGGGTHDGARPYASLIQAADGNFYGTTENGGSAGYGTVFEITPSGTETIVYSFLGYGEGYFDGANPDPGLVWGTDGNFYGMTSYGGPVVGGIVFKIQGPALTYTQWASRYFNATQMANPAISGATAKPQNDGVINLLKYEFGIDPARPMVAADWAALPVAGTSSNDITLTYRQNPLTSGLTVQPQTSPDLQTWTSITPDITQNLTPDPTTGLPVVEIEKDATGLSRDFIRLQLSIP